MLRQLTHRADSEQAAQAGALDEHLLRDHGHHHPAPLASRSR
ncbi:hypothetical protein [Modestobacter sp. I12A-02662]